MTSISQCAARAQATAVLPMPVGPTSTGTLPAPKPPLQLLPGELHDGAAAMHIVRGEPGLEEPEEKPPHLFIGEGHAPLHRRTAGEGGSESFETIGPPAETAPRQVGDQLPETGDP